MPEPTQIFDSFLQNSFDGIIILNTSFQIIHINEPLIKMFSMADSAGSIGASFFEKFNFIKDIEIHLKKIEKNKTVELTNCIFRKSQFHTKLLFDLKISTILNMISEIDYYLITFRDVTELNSKEKSLTKKRLKDALKAYDFSSDRLKTIINSTTDWIVALDNHFRFILYNNSFKTYFENFSGKRINLGVSILDCLRHLPDEQEKVRKTWQEVLNGEMFHSIDKEYNADGSYFYAESIFNLVRDREGNEIGVSRIVRDITERLKSEHLWIASERKFSKVFEEAGIGFLLTELPSKKITAVNPALSELTGYSEAEARDLLIRDFTHPQDYEQEKVLLRQLYKGEISKYHFEKRVYSKTGQEIWISETTTLLYDADNKPEMVLSIVENIHDRKLAQQRLQESEAQKTALINAFPDMIFQLNEQADILDYRSKTPFKILPTQIIGLNIQDLPFPKKIKDRVQLLITKAIASEKVEFYEAEIPIGQSTAYFEVRFVKCASDEVLIIVRDITEKKSEEARIKILLEKERHLNYHLEIQNEKLAIQEKELAVINDQLIAQNENLAHTTKELRKSRENLKNTLKILEERNFELDQFVYKTSHDLRSPLTSILGILNLVKLEKNPDNFLEYFSMIESRVHRLDDFIQSMLEYSRNHRLGVKTELIDLQSLMEECLEDIKYAKGFDAIEKKWQLKGEKIGFYSDSFRLKIILNNLISNSIKYQDADKKQRYFEIRFLVHPTELEILFQDNGIGIEPDYLSNLFKMFYRATELSEGSGLGLYIVKQTIDKLKGKIELKSEGLGKGIEIKITIPNRKISQDLWVEIENKSLV